MPVFKSRTGIGLLFSDLAVGSRSWRLRGFAKSQGAPKAMFCPAVGWYRAVL